MSKVKKHTKAFYSHVAQALMTNFAGHLLDYDSFIVHNLTHGVLG